MNGKLFKSCLGPPDVHGSINIPNITYCACSERVYCFVWQKYHLDLSVLRLQE